MNLNQTPGSGSVGPLEIAGQEPQGQTPEAPTPSLTVPETSLPSTEPSAIPTPVDKVPEPIVTKVAGVPGGQGTYTVERPGSMLTMSGSVVAQEAVDVAAQAATQTDEPLSGPTA